MHRTFIYGSCVTRDAEPWFRAAGLELAGYVARQSLISAFSPARVQDYEFSGIKSAFQRRMTRGDVLGHLRLEIERHAPNQIIWDLCDERHGVKAAPNGGVVTHMRDHVREGIHPGPFGPVIRFGSEEHFSHWKDCLFELLGFLEHVGLGGKIVLNATPWATVDDLGVDLGAVPKEFNGSASRYIEAADDAGIHIARVPADSVVASTNHKWGRAPFHYVDGTYEAQVEAIASQI